MGPPNLANKKYNDLKLRISKKIQNKSQQIIIISRWNRPYPASFSLLLHGLQPYPSQRWPFQLVKFSYVFADFNVDDYDETIFSLTLS